MRMSVPGPRCTPHTCTYTICPHLDTTFLCLSVCLSVCLSITSYHALPKPSGPARAPYALARFAFALDVRAQLEQMRQHLALRYGLA